MENIDLPQGWTWEGVLDRLGEYADLDKSAREHRAIVRVRVIKTGAQLLRLVLAYVLSGLSLRSTVAWAEAAGAASFSDVALLKRLKQCGPWLAHLAARLPPPNPTRAVARAEHGTVGASLQSTPRPSAHRVVSTSPPGCCTRSMTSAPSASGPPR
jgi:hypothetical protein